SEPTFRHKMYDDYKGTRKPMAEELRQQVPVIKEVLHAMGIVTVEQAGYEADDILGTIAGRAEREGLEVSIISGDRDLLQLATDKVKIRIPKTKKGGTEIEDYYAKDVEERYLVTPTQFIDVKALMGDSSDNIPGVPGIGEKGATNIIAAYKSIENAFEHVDEIKPKRAQNALAEHYDLAQMSKTLAAIETNAAIDYDMESAALGDFYTEEAYLWFKRLEFKQMLLRFDRRKEAEDPVENFFRIVADRAEAEKFFAEFSVKKAAVVLLENTALLLDRTTKQNDGSELMEKSAGGAGGACSTVRTDDKSGQMTMDMTVLSGKEDKSAELKIISPVEYHLYGLALACPDAAEKCADDRPAEKCADDRSEKKNVPENNLLTEQRILQAACTVTYIPCTEEIPLAWLNEKLQQICDACETIITPDLKALLKHVSLDEPGDAGVIDVSLAAYLLNPLKNDYSYDDIAKDYLGRMIPAQADLLGKLKLGKAVKEKPEAVARMASYMAYTAFYAADPLLSALDENGMGRLYREIELPLVYVLDSMEQEGVLVDGDALLVYGEQLVGRIEELEESIYDQAGERFNINSPKQLGVILFEKLQMPNGKKTKTGYSTAADVLEKLAPEHPIVSDILEYRQLTKLKSTYAEGLRTCIAADGRIHTTFNQTITATGRLSSTEPNLQNIPIRMELGCLIRKVFIPAEGAVFLDADYSQIELRVLAHMSGDQNLIDAYRHAEDIHRITASQVFHTPVDEVTPLQRRNAKAVNFGIVYGISSFGLSQDLSISRKEAEQYIKNYFSTFPGIREYLDRTVKDAKEKGYAETMFGRRRPVPELSSSNFMQRQFGERIAMNSPIQGTAADIIKIAMIRVYRRLQEEGLKSKLILQVHDELLVETAADETEQVKQILSEEMHHAAELSVDLEVDMNAGENWFEAH
ncbi:MAG: DNA polymerase I, partial [Clostridiales bacterium]|nr:DNA polymerase I [Clostridiales bacterium]